MINEAIRNAQRSDGAQKFEDRAAKTPDQRPLLQSQNEGFVFGQTQDQLFIKRFRESRVDNRRLDALFLADHRSWDLAAGILLITEAGGVVTDELGKETDIHGKYFVATANDQLQQKFLEILK